MFGYAGGYCYNMWLYKVTGGYGWLWMVICGYRMVIGCYGWLYVVISVTIFNTGGKFCPVSNFT